MTGTKKDAGKPEWHLLPFSETEEVVRVLTFGQKKYSAENWKHVEDPRNRYFSAAMRHLAAWHAGETVDHESGLSHLAHAACCMLFLLWFDREKQVCSTGGKN